MGFHNSRDRCRFSYIANDHIPFGFGLLFVTPSLQFDPAPRRGEPHVTRRTPDYFL